MHAFSFKTHQNKPHLHNSWRQPRNLMLKDWLHVVFPKHRDACNQLRIREEKGDAETQKRMPYFQKSRQPKILRLRISRACRPSRNTETHTTSFETSQDSPKNLMPKVWQACGPSKNTRTQTRTIETPQDNTNTSC